MQIKMPRGDYRKVKFQIKDKSGELANIDFKEIYITFKESTSTKEMLFQKRLSKGDIVKNDDGYYHFEILPEETDNLDYAPYYFDIELYNDDPLIKQTVTGQLILTEEITFASNEGE